MVGLLYGKLNSGYVVRYNLAALNLYSRDILRVEVVTVTVLNVVI